MRVPETRDQEVDRLNRKLRLLNRRLQCIEEAFDNEIREIWDEYADIDARIDNLERARMTPAELDAELKRLNGIE